MQQIDPRHIAAEPEEGDISMPMLPRFLAMYAPLRVRGVLLDGLSLPVTVARAPCRDALAPPTQPCRDGGASSLQAATACVSLPA